MENARAPRLRLAVKGSRELVLLSAIVLVSALLAAQSPHFLTPNNLVQVLKNSVDLAVVSAGMTLVIIMGGIDVSVGGILAVSAIFVGRAFQADLPVTLIVPIGLAVGAVLGTANGVIIARGGVPPIIATLGTMFVWQSILFLVIGGSWIAGLPSTLSPLVNGSILGLPAAAVVIAAVYVSLWVLLRHQRFGKHLYAIGSNEAAARLSGINVSRVKILTYALIGLLAGFAAILFVARIRNVGINIGTTIALDAIAATILGGANIRGGVGSLLGTLLGVIFIKIIKNGLVLIGVSSLWETFTIGCLLIVVLTIDSLRERRTRDATG